MPSKTYKNTPKKVQVETPQEVVVETPVEVKVETPQEVVVESKKVIKDNAEVVEILEENSTAKHCKMSNGTTTWVESEYFN